MSQTMGETITINENQKRNIQSIHKFVFYEEKATKYSQILELVFHKI